MQGEVRSIPGIHKRGCSLIFMDNKNPRDKLSLIKKIQDELFHREGCGWFKIISRSMYPLIEVNDRVLVKKLDAHELRSGDIILFKVDDNFITHRIIKILKREGRLLFYQKGDANKCATLISPESIIGKVIAIEKNGNLLSFRSRRIRIINYFFTVKNCFFYRGTTNHDSYIGRIEPKKYTKGFQYLFYLAKKPFTLCQRFIVRILLNG
ncbi:MAG: signal peptidase I [Nitrospira sp.]|nr:signal peptidase I [Nitrospira sp.]